MPSIIKQWLLLSACALAGAAQANGFVFNKAGDEVWDTSTGLVWKRCSVGQAWNGASCTGTAQVFTLDRARAQDRSSNGWRLPTVRQLASLVYCSSGQTRGSGDLQDGGPAIANGCVGSFSTPTINATAFPGTRNGIYWSSSRVVGLNPALSAWHVNFGIGVAYGEYRMNPDFHVRLVRASPLLGGDATLEFVLGRPAYKQGDFAPEVWAQGGAMEQSLGSVTLPWEPKTNIKPLALPSNAPTVDLQTLAAQLKGLALADTNQAPVVGSVSPLQLTEPVREAF